MGGLNYRFYHHHFYMAGLNYCFFCFFFFIFSTFLHGRSQLSFSSSLLFTWQVSITVFIFSTFLHERSRLTFLSSHFTWQVSIIALIVITFTCGGLSCFYLHHIFTGRGLNYCFYLHHIFAWRLSIICIVITVSHDMAQLSFYVRVSIIVFIVITLSHGGSELFVNIFT